MSSIRTLPRALLLSGAILLVPTIAPAQDAATPDATRAKPGAKPAALAKPAAAPAKPAAAPAKPAAAPAKPAAAPAKPAAAPAKPAAAPAKPAAAPAKPAAKPAATAKPPAKPATPDAAARPAVAPAKPKPAAPATPAPAQTAASDEPVLLGQYAEWGAYTAAPEGKKICFAVAKPGSSQTQPPNRPRDPAFLLVSTRPAEKVKDEVSVIIGYTFKPSSEATAAIGGSTFTMFTQGDGAWLKNPAEETKMVEAMRKAPDVVIKGTSGRGTQSTDTFSLKGLTQALDKVAQECK